MKILSSKLLKVKERIKEKGDKNKSVLETIKKFKIEEKAKLHGKMVASQGVER